MGHQIDGLEPCRGKHCATCHPRSKHKRAIYPPEEASMATCPYEVRAEFGKMRGRLLRACKRGVCPAHKPAEYAALGGTKHGAQHRSGGW